MTDIFSQFPRYNNLHVSHGLRYLIVYPANPDDIYVVFSVISAENVVVLLRPHYIF
jgi:hypothetical protein